MPELLTVKDVANRLGVSLKHVHRWVESGSLDVAIDVGRGKQHHYRFERDVVESFYQILKEQTKEQMRRRGIG